MHQCTKAWKTFWPLASFAAKEPTQKSAVHEYHESGSKFVIASTKTSKTAWRGLQTVASAFAKTTATPCFGGDAKQDASDTACSTSEKSETQPAKTDQVGRRPRHTTSSPRPNQVSFAMQAASVQFCSDLQNPR